MSAPLRAGQVEVPVTVEAPGGANGLGAGLGAAPSPVALTVPSLTDSSLLSAPSLAAANAPALVLSGPATVVAGHSPAAVIAAAPALPESAVVKGAAAVHGTPAALKPVLPAAFTPESADAKGGDEAGTVAGRELFDQAAKAPATNAGVPAKSWGTALKSWLKIGDQVPSWPGRAGETVRIGGKTVRLTEKLADGGGSTVWKTSTRETVVKIVHPGFMGLEHYSGEAAVLRAIAKSDVPHSGLIAASKDGAVMLKEWIDGATASDLLARGELSDNQRHGWAELAAKLIRAGVTADLARSNLVWQHWRTRWVIVDAGGLEDAGPAKVLEQLMTKDAFERTGMTRGDFLAGLRGRLGPDSAEWARTVAALKASPKLAPALRDLAARDAALSPAPKLAFGPAPAHAGGLDDAVTTPKEVAKRLGFDPFRVKTRIKLHGEDPGKLNTKITLLEEPGKAPVVMKEAQWYIIAREVAMRRITRRFFGRYFRVPASLAVNAGHDSWMVMEKIDGGPSYYTGPFSKEQRIAAALLVHTFGVGDVNQGNVLEATDRGLPWIIDFEQAFGRRLPNATRLPDERIALEMPWMSRSVPNHAEDYQPAVREWRALLARPETGAAIVSDLVAAGFSAAEAESWLAVFRANAADLDWTLQNDADFVNQFVRRKVF